MRDFSETRYLQQLKLIKDLKKEQNNDEIVLSKLYSFKNKSSRSLDLKFKKENFVLPTAFPCAEKVLLFDISVSNDLKTIFE